MTAFPEFITLLVDGQALQGWQSVTITRSAEAAAISFSLNATNPAWSAQAQLLRKGKVVEIYTTLGGDFGAFGGGDLLCTGYVDDYEADIGEGASRAIVLSGRSKAGDAIDCPPAKHKTGLVENKDLLGVAKEFDEFGIGFFTDQKLKKIPMVQHVPGQSMFKTLEREARVHALLLTGQPDGRVKITRAGSNRHAGALIEGFPPVRSIKFRFSIRNKRSTIKVRGQTRLGVGKTALRQEVEVEDPSVERHRPEVVHHEGSNVEKELRERAEWQRLRRSGSGISAIFKVSTWRDEAGSLWEPGRIVAIQSDTEEVDQDLAISSVAFAQVTGEGEGAGTFATLTLVDPRTLGGKGAGSRSGSGAGNGGGKGGSGSDFTAGLDDAQLDDSTIDYGAYSKRGPA